MKVKMGKATVNRGNQKKSFWQSRVQGEKRMEEET